MRNYTFSGIPYIGNGKLTFGIPVSNRLCTDCDLINTQFVDFFLVEDSISMKMTVNAPSLRSALFLLRHALLLNDLDLLLDVSYLCITEDGKKSSRILRSV